ncbi:MAG: hypothetical protein ACOYIF_07140 [Acetivibrionales bacterium]|jgi:hypothetical protein
MKKVSKARYALYNVFSSGIFQLVTVFAGLLVPRYILLFYGSEINGVSSTINQIISYASLLEAGLGLASIQSLYAPLAKENTESINGICSATRVFYNRVAAYFGIIIFTATVIYPFFVKGSVSRITVALLILVISLPSAVEYSLHAKYRVLLTADQKLFVINYTKAAGLILSTVIKMIIIFIRANIILVFLVTPIVLIFKILYIRWYVYKHYTYIDYRAPLNLTAIKQRSALVIHQIAGLVVHNTGGILLSVSVEGGLKLASVYAVYNLVFKNMYNLITASFSQGIVSSFGQLLYTDKESLKRTFRIYEFIYYVIISVIYGSIYVMVLPFVSLYTKSVTDVQYVNALIALLFTITEVLNCSRVPCNMLINASGHFHQTKVRALIEAVTNFTVTVVLIKWIGIYAIFVGGLCSYLYRVLDIVMYSNKKILGTSPLLTLKKIIQMWMSIIATAMTMTRLFRINTVTWIDFFISSFITFVVACIVTALIFILLDFRQFKTVLSYVINLLTKGKIRMKNARSNS